MTTHIIMVLKDAALSHAVYELGSYVTRHLSVEAFRRVLHPYLTYEAHYDPHTGRGEELKNRFHVRPDDQRPKAIYNLLGSDQLPGPRILITVESGHVRDVASDLPATYLIKDFDEIERGHKFDPKNYDATSLQNPDGFERALLEDLDDDQIVGYVTPESNYRPNTFYWIRHRNETHWGEWIMYWFDYCDTGGVFRYGIGGTQAFAAKAVWNNPNYEVKLANPPENTP